MDVVYQNIGDAEWASVFGQCPSFLYEQYLASVKIRNQLYLWMYS